MKYCELKAIVEFLQQFDYIKLIKRVENNTIKIVFNHKEIYFDMTKSNSTIYIKNSTPTKEFNAPFDTLLHKKFTNSKVIDISLLNQDKIIEIVVQSNSKYKQEHNRLILEFTGKHTNIILTNNNYIILEALHHIDQTKSSKVIKVGAKYTHPPKPNFVFKDCVCDDVEALLHKNYLYLNSKKLQTLKTQKLSVLDKEISKLKTQIEQLQDIHTLLDKSNYYYEVANLLLANIHQIKPYQKQITLTNFQNQQITLELDTSKPINQYIDTMYKKAKKFKQKASNQTIQEQNLTEKLTFYKNLYQIISNAQNIDEIEFYMPKKDKNKKITKKQKPYAEFFYNQYIIRLGRNEKENIYLLENSKASDFWFHLQDQKSSHLIVLNTKKELPSDVVQKAGEILAHFSNIQGSVNIDYTQRRFLKIQNKANVLYTHYKTITIVL